METTCYAMRAAALREKAERIAAEHIAARFSNAHFVAELLDDDAREDFRLALIAAALAALTEKENT